MANVRIVDSLGTTDELFLGGSGAGLSGWGMMWFGRLFNGTGDQPIIAAVNGSINTIGTLYHNGTATLSFGSSAGDSPNTGLTLNLTDYWLLGVTKAAGTTAARFHIKNVTTGAAVIHVDASGGVTAPDVSGAWNHTEIGTADGGAFQGIKRHGAAAIFSTAFSDADFDVVAAARSTQAIYNLTPARLWDFNQASTATAVVNLMTGSSDQTSMTGTSVVADTAADNWTFGVSGGTSATVTVPAHAALGDFPVPAFQAGSTITSPAADAVGDFPDSQMQIGTDVAPPAATSLGDFPVPTVSGTGDSTVTSPAADALGDFPAPTTQWGWTVTAPAATALGDFPAPTITGTASATVTAVPADATADFPAPGISDGTTTTPHYDTPTTFDLDAHTTASDLATHVSTFELHAHTSTIDLDAHALEFALDA